MPRPIVLKAIAIGNELLVRLIIELEEKLRLHLSSDNDAKYLAKLLGESAVAGKAIDWSA